MTEVQYRNLHLEEPISYQDISETISEKELINQFSFEQSREVNKRYIKILYQAIDNCYASSYEVFDIGSNEPELQDFFGFAQFLKRNFYQGYYYLYRAKYFGRDRERLETVLTRLENSSSKNYDIRQETPLFPIKEADSCSTSKVVESYHHICDLESMEYSDAETYLALAEANLSLASHIISNIYHSITNESECRDCSSSHSCLPFFYLLTFQPRKARSSVERLQTPVIYDSNDIEGEKKKFSTHMLPPRIKAHAAAMVGNYREAAEMYSDFHQNILNNNPSIINEGYYFYNFACDLDSTHEFLTDNRAESVEQMGLNMRQQFNQLNARLRKIPPIIVSSISKSGSSFLINQIQDRLGVPKMKIFTTADYDKVKVRPMSLNQFAKGGAACRQHIPPKKQVFQQLAEEGINHVAFHVRDPRRALISWVFYLEAMLRRHSAINFIPRTEIKEYAHLNFQEKIEYQIETFLRPTVKLIENWIEAKKMEPAGVKIKITRFEDMISNTNAFFSDLFSFFGAEEPSIIGNSTIHAFDIIGLFLNVIQSPSEATRFTELFRSPANRNKKRDDDIDEWQEYFSDNLRQQVLDEITKPIRSLYPEHNWTA